MGEENKKCKKTITKNQELPAHISARIFFKHSKDSNQSVNSVNMCG
jgi:hypothetical protein